MIRSSKHSLRFCNQQKLADVCDLVDNYRTTVQEIIDHIWNNGISDFSIQKNRLNCPKFIDASFRRNFNSEYTERMLACAGKQALGMISAATEKRRKQLWQLKQLQKTGQNCKALQRKISLFPLIKPDASNINMELDSRFVDFDFSNQNQFLCFVKISSCKKGESVKIPIKTSPVYERWNTEGKLKASIRLSKKNICLIFDVKDAEKHSGATVGCDQGIKDIVTLSDKQTPPLYQGKISLSDVQQRLSRKKRGSKAFKRTQEFRKNVIGWSLNQLNFSDIKELRVEKLINVRKGKKSSRFLSHWTYTLINEKLYRLSEEKGFLFREVPNEFRSQRCCQCGWVRKANRKGKTFSCGKCGNVMDADLNAASNLKLDLFEIPYWVRLRKINRKGFFWKPDGLFSECQEQITVPDAKRELER